MPITAKQIFDRIADDPAVTELFDQTDECPICQENDVGYELSDGERLCSNCIYARFMPRIMKWLEQEKEAKVSKPPRLPCGCPLDSADAQGTTRARAR